jgi:hypothetical protein
MVRLVFTPTPRSIVRTVDTLPHRPRAHCEPPHTDQLSGSRRRRRAAEVLTVIEEAFHYAGCEGGY